MILRPDWQRDRRLKAAIKKQGKDFGFGGADGKKRADFAISLLIFEK